MTTLSGLRRKVLEKNFRTVCVRTSAIFFWLLLGEWLLAILLALLVSPYAWAGRARTLHVHLEVAVFLGGSVNALPLVLLRTRPDWWFTRQVVAVAQMLWSAMLIHITGGRIETHFHIFGSLAFLAFYRDWRVLPTATLVVAADHLLRGLLWPESVYGIANPEWWRFLEHAAWIAFEDIVLVFACVRSIDEMHVVADREAALATLNADIERVVIARTAELARVNESLATEMQTRLLAEAELRQAQKLEAVGRLASGVAHEINTPVQFVSDSLHFLRDASIDLVGVVEKLQKVQRSVLEGGAALDEAREASVAEEAADLPYLFENVPKAFDRALDGLGRVTTIVRSMKEFAHPDSKDMTRVDINAALESTLTITRNEYKYVADLETDFGELPLVECYAGELNQAVLNLVVNAAHAIGEAVKGSDQRGRICVRTRREGRDVVIAIADTGCGIPEEIQGKIFDPFFTTKEVGKGTGQGLSIARSVVKRLEGELTFETEPGKGTTFYVRVPIEGPRVKGGAGGVEGVTRRASVPMPAGAPLVT